MKISLCLIVRDEQDMLPGCLSSVQGVVDEIVLVDTGSRDQTVAIAERLGAKVSHFPWTDDFSAARNLSLQQASGDWVLVLDADERLATASAKVLRQTLERTKAEGLRVHVRDRVRDADQVDYLVNVSTRLFRNRPEYRYQRRVHEQIEVAIAAAKLGPPPELADIWIEHLGYLPEVVQRKQKRQRNLQLLEAEAGISGDGFTCYNLGVEYIRHQRHREALAALDQAIARLDPRSVVAAAAVHRKAICLLETEDYDAALSVLQQGARRYPDFTDLVYHQGEALARLQRYREAIAAFQQCRSMGDSVAGYYSLQGIGGYRAAYAIGLVHQTLRNFPTAIRWYRQSLQENAQHLPAIMRIAEVLREALPASQALTELRKYFDLTLTEQKLAYLNVLSAVGFHQPVPTLVQELLSVYPGAPGLLGKGAVSAFHAGRMRQSISWAEELCSQNSSMLEPLLLVLVAFWALGELDAAQAVISRLSGRGEMMLHAVCQQMQWYVEGRDSFSLSIDFADPAQHRAFHESALQVLRWVVISGRRELLAKLLPILSPLEGLDAWLQLGLLYYQHDLHDLAWAELRDCERQGKSSSQALFVLGKLALRRRLLQLAVDYLWRVVSAEPANIEARQLMSTACQQLAEQLLLEGLERFPDAQVLVEELEWLKRGSSGSDVDQHRQTNDR